MILTPAPRKLWIIAVMSLGLYTCVVGGLRFQMSRIDLCIVMKNMLPYLTTEADPCPPPWDTGFEKKLYSSLSFCTLIIRFKRQEILLN